MGGKRHVQLWAWLPVLTWRLQGRGAAFIHHVGQREERDRPWSKEQNREKMRTSLAIQWLRLLTSNAGGSGSIPGPGTKMLHGVAKK